MRRRIAAGCPARRSGPPGQWMTKPPEDSEASD
ncbi:MAG: hypothetical protein DCC65_13905 [Planctomycetota bacterium]|nr:MAG: hypothetical protein DCC65_13905 [Planctomycetota bacterium]